MISRFNYLRPQSLQEALELLASGKREIRPLGGGTDIIPGLQQQSRRFRGIHTLLDIHHLPELRNITAHDSGVMLGAAVTFQEIVESPLIRERYPLLARAAAGIGSLQIRNRATLAGNFVNNAPCADSVPPLLVYQARLHLKSLQGERRLYLQEFLAGPYRTRLQPGELVTEIELPPPPPGYRGDFWKLGRRRGVAISRITLAVVLLAREGVLQDIRLACGAITPIGVRLTALEEEAKGQVLSSYFLKSLAVRVGEKILEMTGLRWSTPYKLPVVQQMAYHLLKKLCDDQLAS